MTDQTPQPSVTRRTVLRWGTTVAATGMVLSNDPVRLLAAPNPDPAASPPAKLTFTTRLRRAADQLDLTLEFWNLELVTGDGPARLQREKSNKGSYLVVEFPPQAIAEQAFYRAGGSMEDDAQEPEPPYPPPSGGEPPAPPPIAARMANPTRLAFYVPASVLPMPYTVPRLLSWLDLTPRVVDNATARDVLPAQLKSPTAPSDSQTAIELPWHLVLSPHAQSAWAHAHAPVNRGGRTELWHTRLAVRGLDGQGQPLLDEDDEDGRTVRAVWCTDDDPEFKDYVKQADPPSTLAADIPFRTSLTRRDRLDLVRLSSDFGLSRPGRAGRQGADGGPFVPEVVEVDRLMLTALGGYLDSSFDHELRYRAGAYNTSLLQWRHLAAMGRDSYVRVVRKGFLFPYGFKAALVRITERRIDHIADLPTKPAGAYLRQRVFIVVLKARRRLAGDPALRHGGRQVPFRSLTCVTKATPPLSTPTDYAGLPESEVFVPSVDGVPYAFDLRVTDWSGATVPLSAPAVWVDEVHAYDSEALAPIISAYQSAPESTAGAAHAIDLEGREIAFAPPKDPGDTTFVVRSLAVGAEEADPAFGPDDLAGAGNPGFYPTLGEAQVELSTGGQANGPGGAPSARFGYHPDYVVHGFGQGGHDHPNRGDVLFTRVGQAPAGLLSVDTKQAGGAATPALAMEGWSRELGPTGDPEDTRTGSFDPAKVLGDEARILGGIALKTVLAAVGDFLTDKEKALKIVSRQETGPNRVVTLIDFHPDLQAGPLEELTLFAPDESFGKDYPPKADIHAEIVTNIDDPSASTSRVDGRITGFVILLFGGERDGEPGDTTFIRVPVQHLEFKAGSSTKDELHIQLGDISFHGVLAFVEELSSLLAFGDSGGLKIDVDGTGIQIELMVALPDISVGVLSLTNMAIFVKLVIPFDGSPVELLFAFCSRENPFTLTVWIFGGGGFVGITVSVRGVELFELAFEFGGGYALSLAGLASGKVEAKSGIYFRVETLEDDTQQCTLESYFRIAGAVSILGLITVSIEFYVSLTYSKPPGSLVGEARLTVEIDLTVWSTSVELTVRKELAKGDGGDSSFAAAAPAALEADNGPAVTWADLMTAADWEQQYVTAYAPMGA